VLGLLTLSYHVLKYVKLKALRGTRAQLSSALYFQPSIGDKSFLTPWVYKTIGTWHLGNVKLIVTRDWQQSAAKQSLLKQDLFTNVITKSSKSFYYSLVLITTPRKPIKTISPLLSLIVDHVRNNKGSCFDRFWKIALAP
jgi:hypothetical protein